METKKTESIENANDNALVHKTRQILIRNILLLNENGLKVIITWPIQKF